MKVLIVACHPDDMEMMMGGTALLLGRAGCELHYLNVARGDAGSAELPRRRIAALRRAEAARSAALLGATLYPSLAPDCGVFYEQRLIRRVTALVRRVKPDIVLTQSLEDYMDDHMNTGKIASTATFLRNVANYRSIPREPPAFEDVMLYHSTPHILGDMMRNPIAPELFVDVSSVIDEKERLLACHASQKEWLDRTQGFGSYLAIMRELCARVGALSGAFALAEGWRRHDHVGFSQRDGDPLGELLGGLCRKRA